ncbi:hypothetical protein JQK87_03185 [Streptomyces sp. G44]|uniref:hypothetical protein n=1 Tax=Streptomyces sp. G44 TaxID=2807632 RepID=UPI00195F5828|nr:hypothetical protein [Streptomyces sp. G44]MBM7167438.1 hypothetical protein [Streptomyces sp. G44]
MASADTRHSFAVVTLEQLHRAHIAQLAELNPRQRGHYTRIFGDPLDWVRRRLGHRSNTTFRRHFPDIAQEIAALRSAPPTPGSPSEPTRYDRLVARNAKLKRHNRELTETLTLAACHIQRITLENQKLREELEAATGVTRLTPTPSRRPATS